MNSAKRKKTAIISICLALLLSPLAGVALSREKPSIEDMAVINSGHNLLLYFKVNNPFTPEMEKGIKNGIPVTFSFYIVLYKNRSAWFDKELVSYKLERSLDYDNLKDVYRVKMSGKRYREVTRKKLEDAKKMMKEVNDFDLIELDKLKTGGNYFIQAKVSLEKKTLPLNFQNIIPFWNLWEFETEWTELNFFIPTSSSSKIKVTP